VITHPTINKKDKRMKKTLTMLIIITIVTWASFSKNGNIVTDSTSKLQWQDDATGSRMTWQSAIDHCEGLSLDSFDDWRLPNKNELISIVDYSKYDKAIDSHFQNTISSYYWSSSTSASYTYRAWYVSFSDGNTYDSNKNDSMSVRCVRAGQ
jgi:hypothetical protein